MTDVLWSELVVRRPESEPGGHVCAGGANGTRTRDPLLAKVVLAIVARALMPLLAG
jgi:hypothetical protein